MTQVTSPSFLSVVTSAMKSDWWHCSRPVYSPALNYSNLKCHHELIYALHCLILPSIATAQIDRIVDQALGKERQQLRNRAAAGSNIVSAFLMS